MSCFAVRRRTCTAQVTGPADRMELEHPAGVGLLTSRLSAILLDRQACGEVATTRTAWEDVKLFPRYLVECRLWQLKILRNYLLGYMCQ